MHDRRYAAFLRGVTPMNASMPQLRRCFEGAGFTGVRSVLSSGNVVFGARTASEASLQRRAERAMSEGLGRTFLAIVRTLDALREILRSDPYAAFRLPPRSKRVVTLLRDMPSSSLSLPIEVDGARILCARGREIFSAYVPSPRGPVFMGLIERTFGKELTTRTWETIEKVVGADRPAACSSVGTRVNEV